MRDNERRTYEMFIRASAFWEKIAPSFQPESMAIKLFTDFKSIIDQLTKYSTTKNFSNRSAKQGTVEKAVLRSELRADLLAISRTARGLETDIADLEGKFRMPRRLNDQLLLNNARTFCEAARPLEAEFVKFEMPADFIKNMAKNIELFEKALNDQNEGTEERVMAAAAIEDAIDQGVEIVKKLNIIVRNKFEDDPSTLAGWVRARHVERAPRPVPAPVEETPQPAKTGS
jgi:hypothetical protein